MDETADNPFPRVSALVKWFENRPSEGGLLNCYEEENSGQRDVLRERLQLKERDGQPKGSSVNGKQEHLQYAGWLQHVKELFSDEEEFFDLEFDADFSGRFGSDDVCWRSEQMYERPWGWYRMALKVMDKYPDGNTWLGEGGWRNHSSPGEWPVCYHGTSLEGAKGIIKSNYKAGEGQVYGRGIYSSPKVSEAKKYGAKCRSEKTGKTYRVMMQNRINPKERVKCSKDYWFIPIPKGTSVEEERKIVERSIRPYGVLIQEVNP